MMKNKKLWGLCVTAAFLLVGCGTTGGDPAAESGKTAATATPTAEVIVTGGAVAEGKNNNAYRVEGDTVYVEQSNYLLDVTAKNATKMVLRGDACLLDASAVEVEDDDCESVIQPQYQSWFAGCPQVEKIEVQVEENAAASDKGINKLYTDGDLLMYGGKSQGVYACPITKKGKVTIPDGTRDIYDCAFMDCDKIGTVVLPESVRWAGSAAFGNNSKLKAIEVSKDNPYLKSVDGVLYTKDGRVLLAYPAGKQDQTYRIPDGVVYIGDGAFMGAKNLKEITLPKGIYDVGDFAFKNCTKLEKIHSGKVYCAHNTAYAYCDALSSKEWLKCEVKQYACPWEQDYKDDFMSDWNEVFPWKYDMNGYGNDDAEEIIKVLKENLGKVPKRLAGKIRSLQHNYAKSELYTEAVVAETTKEFEKKLDHFTSNYGK